MFASTVPSYGTLYYNCYQCGAVSDSDPISRSEHEEHERLNTDRKIYLFTCTECPITLCSQSCYRLADGIEEGSKGWHTRNLCSNYQNLQADVVKKTVETCLISAFYSTKNYFYDPNDFFFLQSPDPRFQQLTIGPNGRYCVDFKINQKSGCLSIQEDARSPHDRMVQINLQKMIVEISQDRHAKMDKHAFFVFTHKSNI